MCAFKQVVRDQLRKGGAKSKPGTVPGTADNTTEDEGEDQVSDSEGSDDDEAEQLAKREHSAKYSRFGNPLSARLTECLLPGIWQADMPATAGLPQHQCRSIAAHCHLLLASGCQTHAASLLDAS